ncbi:MAG: TonB-dependent receptor [Pseudomonadota bacterium]
MAIAATAAPAAFAQSSSTQQVSIEAQPLGEALVEVARRYGVSVIASRELTQGKRAPSVNGALNAQQALDRVLAGSDLTYRRERGGYVISRASRQRSSGNQSTRSDTASVSPTDARGEEVDETSIIVTGTNIRGLTPESTPLQIINRDEIIASGQGSTRDFLRTLPQNFGGGADDSFPFNLPGDATVGEDFSEGTAINLRGLGAGSTLTLLNGRRLAPSSNVGAYTDISMIPLSAIERIEILTDGASAIYGSDAVAGVANFVLRDDYEGLEATGRYGFATEDGASEYRANVTAGTVWGGGNGLITYEYYDRGDLDVSDRDFSRAIPSRTSLLPSREQHSVLASISQSIAADLEFSADLLYSTRDTSRNGFQNNGVDPRIDFSSTDTLTIGGELDWQISSAFNFRLIGNYSTLDTEAGTISPIGANGVIRDQSARTFTSDAILNGSLFEMAGGMVRFAAGAQYRRETFVNLDGVNLLPFADGTRNVYALFGEVFIPVIDEAMEITGVRRLELNISGRYEDYSDFGSSTDPKVGVLYSPIEGLRFRGTYSTSFRPPALGRTGATDRETRFFTTGFINSIFGITPSDPSVADVPVLELIGTGSGLGAETSESWTVGADYDLSWDNHQITLRSTYFDTVFKDRINTPPIPGGFSLAAVNEFARDPSAFIDGTVIPNPSQAQIDATLALSNFPVQNFAPSISLDDTQFIVNNTTINVSRTSVNGIDLNLRYKGPLSTGEMSVGLNGTYLMEFSQQGAPVVPVIDSLNTLFNPIDLNLRGEVGYQEGAFSGHIFVNYADSYRTADTQDARPIGSFTTVDLSLTYSFPRGSRADLLEGTSLRVFVQNLLNEEPPQIGADAPTSIFSAFDPANASALQRFIAFEVTKAF